MKQVTIGDEALSVLMRYGWPGNVRQIVAVLFRAALLARGQCARRRGFPAHRDPVALRDRRTDFTPNTRQGAQRRSDLRRRREITLYTDDGHLRSLEEIEADVIRLAIGHYRGRMTEVARRLGIGRSTLYRKLGDLGIDTAA